jgi:hypothetical protein
MIPLLFSFFYRFSFWGKFGQRLNLKQSQFLHESEIDRFFQLLTDRTKQIEDFHIVSDDIVQLQWIHQNAFVPIGQNTNIYLATLTTCWARLKLYDVLDILNTRVYYYDTDSVIYVSRHGCYDNPLGDFLCELTNELDGNQYITEFLASGPKVYSFKANKVQEICKIRGFTLNYKNNKLINFNSSHNQA